MQELLADAASKVSTNSADAKLKARYSEFYLCDELQTSEMPLQSVFKELSTQVRVLSRS